MTNRAIVIGIVMAGFMLLAVGGCSSKVSKENFDKLKVGMTQAQIEEIMGKPTDVKAVEGDAGRFSGSANGAVWQDGKKAIIVMYMDGKAVGVMANGL